MMKLTDTTPMPFGKLYYNTPMVNVPASYLLWVYDNISMLRPDLKMYIEENMEVLKQQQKSELKKRKYDRRNESR